MKFDNTLREVGDTLTLQSLTATNPTEATVSEADAAKVGNGDTLMLSFDPPNDQLSGSLGIVDLLMGTTFTIQGVDLSAIDTDGITAQAIVTEVAVPPAPPPPPDDPVPPPPPAPSPGDPDWVASPTPPPVDPLNPYPSPGHAVGYYPSPGLGPVPVAPHPDAAQRAQQRGVLTAHDVVQTTNPPREE